MLIPEKERGKEVATVNKSQEMSAKKLILKIHHFPFLNFINTTVELQYCLELYKAIKVQYLKTSIRFSLKTALTKEFFQRDLQL